MDKSANNESSLLKQALLAIQDREARLERAQRAQREPIAVDRHRMPLSRQCN